MRYLLPGLVLPAMLAAAPALADKYVAVSKTAESITGDVTMDDFGIRFANGRKLAFSDLVADHFMADGKRRPGSVYRIEKPADPVLLNGNRLCGTGKVTYLANWLSDSGLNVIAVFTGDDAPESADEMCASYTYE